MRVSAHVRGGTREEGKREEGQRERGEDTREEIGVGGWGEGRGGGRDGGRDVQVGEELELVWVAVVTRRVTWRSGGNACPGHEANAKVTRQFTRRHHGSAQGEEGREERNEERKREGGRKVGR